MLDLQSKCAHTLVVIAWNVQALRREVELVFGHGLGSFHNLLFDHTDLTVHGGSYGWRSLRLLRSRRAPAGAAVCALSQGGHGKHERRRQQEKSYSFHSSEPSSN